MLAMMVDAALRSSVLSLAVLLGVRMLRVSNPHALMATWQLVLAFSLVMPLTAGWADLGPRPAMLPIPALVTPALGPAGWLTAPYAAPATVHATAMAIDWRMIATAIYGFGAGLLLLRLLIGTALSWRLCRAATPVQADWTAGRDVRASGFVNVPLSVGSIILLPASYARWDELERRAVIAHESAHIDGGDFHILMLAALNRAIFWFSPVAWWLHHHLAILAETRSDAVAIEGIGDRLRYAEILLAFGSKRGRRAVGLAIASPHTMRRRVERIVAQKVPPKKLGWKAWSALAACILSLAALSAGAVAQAPSSGAPMPSAANPITNYDAATVARLFADQSQRRREIPIDPSLLDKYAGYYRLATDTVVTVSRESDHLLVRTSGEYDWPVYPERPDKFFYKIMPAQISFVTDARGQVTGLILHQNGVEAPAQRIDRAQAQTIEASLGKRIKDAEPFPDSATALRRQIDGLAQGKPDFAEMTNELAGMVTQWNPNTRRHLTELGPLQSMAFLGVGTEGWDIYQAKFENGMMISRILLAPDGKVANLQLGWGP